MASSHHFIGRGACSTELVTLAQDAELLLDAVATQVEQAGLTVMSRHHSRFPGGGLTAVWILAESHLVLHHWAAEGFATLDLHVCDYERPNAARARSLARGLSERLFADEPAPAWRELTIGGPNAQKATPTSAPASNTGVR